MLCSLISCEHRNLTKSLLTNHQDQEPVIVLLICPLTGHLRQQKPQRRCSVILPLPQNGFLPARIRHICTVFTSVPGGHVWVEARLISNAATKSTLLKWAHFDSPCSISVCYGSWFDHVIDWTNQLATMNNLLHITYEEMSLVKEKLFMIDSSDWVFNADYLNLVATWMVCVSVCAQQICIHFNLSK